MAHKTKINCDICDIDLSEKDYYRVVLSLSLYQSKYEVTKSKESLEVDACKKCAEIIMKECKKVVKDKKK
jgi:hypothetical protein